MTGNLSRAFSALGDRTRFAIVDQLLRDGEKSAGEIVDSVSLSAPAVSRHLKVLHSAGVLDRRVARQKRLYTVRPDMIRAINRWTMDHQAFWSSALDRLEQALNKDGLDD